MCVRHVPHMTSRNAQRCRCVSIMACPRIIINAIIISLLLLLLRIMIISITVTVVMIVVIMITQTTPPLGNFASQLLLISFCVMFLEVLRRIAENCGDLRKLSNCPL